MTPHQSNLSQHSAKQLPCFQQPLQGCQPGTALIPVACGQADLQAWTALQHRSEQHAVPAVATNIAQPHLALGNSHRTDTCSKNCDNVLCDMLHARSSFSEERQVDQKCCIPEHCLPCSGLPAPGLASVASASAQLPLTHPCHT